MKTRLAISALIGFASGLICWLMHLGPRAVDFGWSLQAAHDLALGHNPYGYALPGTIPYPVPAAGFALPFLWLWTNPKLAGALFFGASSAILAFGLSRSSYDRLLVFLACPYWMAMMTVQWSPLVMAGALFPTLLPAALAKPQIGLPIILTHWSRRGILACAALAAVSLLIMPSWPLRWFSQLGGFQNYIPMLSFPGPLLLLGLCLGDEADAHLLLLTSLMPQHWFYDTFILWLIPKSRSEILATVCMSWGVVLWWPQFGIAHYSSALGSMAVLWIYLPMLALLLLRSVVSSDSPTLAVHPPSWPLRTFQLTRAYGNLDAPGRRT